MKVLIYGVGGGFGHAMRGAAVYRRLVQEGCYCLAMVRRGSERYLDPDVRLTTVDWSLSLASQFDAVVIDTFPRGWQGEISVEDIRRFSKSIFIARYRKGLNRDELEVFDEIWDPYPQGRSEWGKLPGAQPVGWLIDHDRYQNHFRSNVLMILDPGDRLRELARRMVTRASVLGWDARYAREIPKTIEAEKILIVGAGYNTFYETQAFHDRVRFVPLPKRYDDQSHRAGALAIHTLHDFESWLIQSRSVAASSSLGNFRVP